MDAGTSQKLVERSWDLNNTGHKRSSNSQSGEQKNNWLEGLGSVEDNYWLNPEFSILFWMDSVEFRCSPRTSVGLLQIDQFPPTVQKNEQ